MTSQKIQMKLKKKEFFCQKGKMTKKKKKRQGLVALGCQQNIW